MEIPFDIKIFNLICEGGKYLLPFLFVLWLTWLICVIVLRWYKQFLLTSVVFLLFCLLGASFTWCGWHYRMKLYEQYAVTKQGDPGWQKGKKTYNINLMPSDIRREYDKNGGRPRSRGVIAKFIWMILLTPITLLVQWILYLIFFRRRKSAECTE